MTETATLERLVLRTVDPITDPRWYHLVMQSPSLVYHSPQWMRALQNTYDFPFSASILENPARHRMYLPGATAPLSGPIAGVPWSEVDDLMGKRRVSLPFSDLCNIIAPTPAEAATLAENIVHDGVPWTLRSTSSSIPGIATPVVSSVPYKWQWIDLTADESTLWRRIVKNTRTGVRKAAKEGVVVRQAQDKSDLRAWYLLHLRLRKYKYHLLAQSYRFFEELWDSFIEDDQGFLLVGTYQGQIINGAFCLLWKDVCTYKFTTSDPQYLILRPNNLLHWQVMLLAKSMGYRLLDHGRSKAHQEGLLAFKRAFGAQEEDLLAVTYGAPQGEDAQRQDAQHILSKATGLLVDASVPDEITEMAGARFYRYFA